MCAATKAADVHNAAGLPCAPATVKVGADLVIGEGGGVVVVRKGG